MGHAPVLAGIAPVQDTLHPLPKLDRDQRLVLALIELVIPLEAARIQAIAQNRMNSAPWDRIAALAIDESCGARLLGQFLQCILAGRIPLEQLGDDGRDLRIDGDHLPAIWPGNVAVAEWRLGRPDALFGLLLQALSRLLRQVVDVVLGHQHLDAVHEHFRGARLARQLHSFLGEVDLGV